MNIVTNTDSVKRLPCGALQTWLRVFLGFHTWPQVLVGAALGSLTAVSWFKLGTAWALPALQKSATGLGVLYTVTGLGAAAFGVKVISGWWKERQQQQQRHDADVQRLEVNHGDGGEGQLLLAQDSATMSGGHVQLGHSRPTVVVGSELQAMD